MEILGGVKDYIRSRYFRIRELLSPSKFKSAYDIPIIINSFNRKTTLEKLIFSLEKRGYKNIVILDNKSTYPPLLEYYKTIPYEIIWLDNLGFKALWKAKHVRKRFCSDYYIYTDSDVELDDNCPYDLIESMLDLLKNRYKNAFKIGPSLRIDDLPHCFSLRDKVIEWESRYFANEPNGDNLYRAPIDTTFALYRPRIGLSRRSSLESYRMASPYQIKHLPWYADSNSLDEEELHYKSQCRCITMWSSK